MIRSRWAAYVLISAAALAGCSDDDSGGTPFTIPSFPSQIGTRWSYDLLVALENIRLRIPGTEVPFDSIQGVATVVIEGVVTLDDPPGSPSIEAKEFAKEEIYLNPSPGNPEAVRSHSYYTVTDSGLYKHGYTMGGAVVPPMRKPGPARIIFAGRSYASIAELVDAAQRFLRTATADSIVREVPPLLELPYPLAVPMEWNYRSPWNPFLITKRAQKDTTLRFGIASYPCVVVRWIYDLNGDGIADANISIEDYVSTIGYLRRTILFKDIMFTSEQNPDVLGVVDLRTTYTLTSFITP